MAERKKDQKKKESDVKTITVPLALGRIKENISISTDSQSKLSKLSKLSKQELINKATNLHLEGNIQEAMKFYQYFINQGFSDHSIFSNYGLILKTLGKLKEAESLQRKAIGLKPDYAKAYSNLGTVLRDIGKLKEAESSIRKGIELQPNSPGLHSNLGLVLRDLGKLKEAEIETRKAISLKYDSPNAHSNLGNILKELGKLNEAELSLRKAIALQPDFANAHSNLGTILRDIGNLKGAELSFRKAIELQPNLAEFHSNLGLVFRDLGKLKEAELSTRKAIQLNPFYANAYANLGEIFSNFGKLKEAKLSIRKAIEIEPDFAEAHLSLGNIFIRLGKLKEAELSTRKAIQLNPNSANAHCNLGNILRDLGTLKGAELSLCKAIELKPNVPEYHSNLGLVFRDLGKLQEAELSTRKAIELKPDLAEAHSNLGTILSEMGREADAKEYFASAFEKSPNDLCLYLNSNLIFSIIMNDEEQIDRERENYRQKIKAMENLNTLEIGRTNGFNPSMFYLAYQNRLDDKVILEKLSSAISKSKGMICKDFSVEKYLNSSKKRKSLKIGICSIFLNQNHTVGKLYLNILIDLLKTDLDITIYLPPGFIRDSALDNFKRLIELPNSPQLGSKLIASDELDLIFYPDIGMCSYTYMLALSRLALVQVNSIGHANTSGIKNIDYLITYGIEPRTSDARYTEKLVRFSRLPFNYPVPRIKKTELNSSVLDSKNKFIIGIPQSLFKLHPSYDRILESILIEIKDSYLILVKDKSGEATQAIKTRWDSKHRLLLKRSIFFERMNKDNFMNMIRQCHIMLDPFYFGSGNTFYESMAFGIPFITYPHNQKTKIAAAGYKQMQVKNPPIANSPEDYIAWCKSYSNNRLLLEQTKIELIKQANKHLFNDSEIYKEYYEFFLKSVKKAKKLD